MVKYALGGGSRPEPHALNPWSSTFLNATKRRMVEEKDYLRALGYREETRRIEPMETLHRRIPKSADFPKALKELLIKVREESFNRGFAPET